MTAPFGKSRQMVVQPQATAGSNLNTPVLVVESDGAVSSVTYTTVTAITGANTNTRSVSLVNKGAAGAGTTIIATLQFNSGVNTTAADEKAITLSATAADLNVVAGDVLQWQSTAVGTGIADPGGLVNVVVAGKYA
jgi:hypothetical protein